MSMQKNDLNIIYKLVNLSIKQGKKSVAEKHMRKAFVELSKNSQESVIEVIDSLYKHTQPMINFKKQRKIYKPTFIDPRKKNFLACSWILDSANKNTQSKFSQALAQEFINIKAKKSSSIKKCQEFHQEALDKMNIVKKRNL
jgi:small subunit ribosomal protein S7